MLLYKLEVLTYRALGDRLDIDHKGPDSLSEFVNVCFEKVHTKLNEGRIRSHDTV